MYQFAKVEWSHKITLREKLHEMCRLFRWHLCTCCSKTWTTCWKHSLQTWCSRNYHSLQEALESSIFVGKKCPQSEGLFIYESIWEVQHASIFSETEDQLPNPAPTLQDGSLNRSFGIWHLKFWPQGVEAHILPLKISRKPVPLLMSC